MFRSSWVAFAALVAGLACSGVSTHVQSDKMTDFKRYKSYAWAEQTLSSDRPRVPPEEVRAWIAGALDQGLASKGLRAAQGAPDVFVAFYGSAESKTQVVPVDYGQAPGSSGTVEFREGTLVVDLMDASQKRVVWRGVAESALKNTGVTKPDIESAVNKLLKEYPPN